MKSLLYTLTISLLIIGCGPSTSKKEAKNTEESAQSEETEAMLLDVITKEELKQEPYSEWFLQNYNDYSVDDVLTSKISNTINDFDITVFMGTWCSDSQREIPVLFKILEATAYDMSKFKLIAVDRDKVTPENLQEGFNVELVPTIIFSKNGIEVNRFVEYARETLAEDIYKIVSGQPYKHSYAE